MKTKLAVLFALLALAPFALAACGDDDDEPATDEAPIAEPDATGDDGDTADGGGASTVEFTADPGGSLAFEEASAEAEAGSVTLVLTNDSSVPHDVRVEGPDGDIGGTDQITEGEAEATVELDPGDYTFYCSVPGHREAGMEGTLTVE